MRWEMDPNITWSATRLQLQLTFWTETQILGERVTWSAARVDCCLCIFLPVLSVCIPFDQLVYLCWALGCKKGRYCCGLLEPPVFSSSDPVSEVPISSSSALDAQLPATKSQDMILKTYWFWYILWSNYEASGHQNIFTLDPGVWKSDINKIIKYVAWFYKSYMCSSCFFQTHNTVKCYIDISLY